MKSLKSKVALMIFFSYLSCLFLFHRLLRAFNKCYDITHTKYPTGHTFRIKSLQRIHLLAISNEFDGFTTHFPDRQCGTTTRVTVKFGEYSTGYTNCIIKYRRQSCCLLTSHRINNKKGLICYSQFLCCPQLSHKLFIYLQSTSSVNNHHIDTFHFCLLQSTSGNLSWVDITAHIKYRHTNLLAEAFQLVNCSRAINISGNH
mmetsp:Transcript_4919/g.22001  ORF Transcript_4919/g.22001 Transcript_4919/m.22001 type:complete len:202 (-) Transcript_4919:754-1359(-)